MSNVPSKLAAVLKSYREALSRTHLPFFDDHPHRPSFHRVLEKKDPRVAELASALAKSEIDRIELMEELQAIEKALDKWRSHYAAREAQAVYLMELLDTAYGPEANPARAIAPNAEGAPEEVPYGPRKGETMTAADLVYLHAFAENFHTHFSKRHGGEWLEFLNEKLRL